jgi:hypothetical protein
MALSSNADTRVVAAKITGYSTLTGTVGSTVGASTDITWDSAPEYDTHGGFNGTTTYTIKVAGYYRIFARTIQTGTEGSDQLIRVVIMKSGTEVASGYQRLQTTGLTAQATEVLTSLKLNVGDTLTVRHVSQTTGVALATSSSSTYWTIEAIQGPQQIAASETIAVGAVRSANQTGINPNNSYVQLQPNSTAFDTHATWNTSTYRFTAPAAGKYRISASAALGSINVLANQYMLYLYKNGSSFAYIDQRYPSVSTPFGLSGSLVVNLVAGDYLELYLYGAGNNSASTLTAPVVNVYIERAGN